MIHYSVLKTESINGLNIKPDGIYVDCTLGYAGHSSEILKQLTTGHLYAFDQDINAVNYSTKELSKISNNFTIIHDNFSNILEQLNEIGVEKVDGILYDLGLSSPQIDNTERGFSFQRDARLDMRMNESDQISAYDIVNNYKEEELTNIFYIYGEEKLSKAISRKIVAKRTNKEIKTTLELVETIKEAVGLKYFNLQHPERQIFQAIRIEVNNELGVLRKTIPDAIKLLNVGGRISVITFHSLEDRIVKQIFKQQSDIDPLIKGLPSIPDKYLPVLKLVNKKPILPTELEIQENSRSKSAKLRVVEKIKNEEE